MTTYLQVIKKPSRYIKRAAVPWTVDSDAGTAVLNDPSYVATPDEVIRYIYTHPSMTPEGRKILDDMNARNQLSLPNVQGVLVDPRNERAFAGIWRMLSNAAIDQFSGKKSFVYSTPGMHSLYNTQAQYFDSEDDYGKPAFKIMGRGLDRLWLYPGNKMKKIPWVGKKIDQKIRNSIYDNTMQVIFKPHHIDNVGDPHYFDNKGSDAENFMDTSQNQSYVAPALAAGAPLALLGGMIAPKNKLLTGIGILGAAGLAGAAYGNARKNGWKGWAPVEHGVASFNNFVNKKN